MVVNPAPLILPIDAAVADRWGLLAANAKSAGKPLSAIDGSAGAERPANPSATNLYSSREDWILGLALDGLGRVL